MATAEGAVKRLLDPETCKEVVKMAAVVEKSSQAVVPTKGKGKQVDSASGWNSTLRSTSVMADRDILRCGTGRFSLYCFFWVDLVAGGCLFASLSPHPLSFCDFLSLCSVLCNHRA
jgi:hypothetical protein